MPDPKMITQWNRRPHEWVYQMICLGLGCLAVLVGFVLLAKSNLRQLLWPIGMTILGLLLWVKGGPMLLRAAEKLGLFGRVFISDGRLFLNKRATPVDLSQPFSVEARKQQSTIVRRVDLLNPFSSRGASTGGTAVRTETRIFVLTLTIEQDGRRYHLEADETNHHRVREFNLDGLNIRRVPVQAPGQGPAARLWPADLADLLRVLQDAAGYATALSPIPDRGLKDPRKAFFPTWKTAAGMTVVLLLTLGATALTFSLYQAEHNRQVALMIKAAEEQKHRRQVRADALVGKRVMIPVRDNVQMFGIVDKARMEKEVHYDPDYRIEWRARLTVKIDNLSNPEKSATPGEDVLTFRHADDKVMVGSLVEVYFDEVRVMNE